MFAEPARRLARLRVKGQVVQALVPESVPAVAEDIGSLAAVLLTITSTAESATDLGYLLHKNPGRIHEKELSFGIARVVYPEASEERCTAALVVDIDPVELVRGRRGSSKNDRRAATLSQYVNDRPYAASSFLSVAISKMFGTAMTGRSKDRPELAEQALPLVARLPAVPARGGELLVRSLFEPLGYAVEVQPIALDPLFEEWGSSRYLDVELTGTVVLRDLLEHLFVLLPVLDDDKHYWVGDDEIDKLLRRGGEWLAAHPDRELITRRYLRHDRRLTSDALERLIAADGDVTDPDAVSESHDDEEAAVERPVRLNDQRLAAVTAELHRAGARRIVDLGCGPGSLLQVLLKESWVDQVVGVDASWRALERASRRLHFNDMPPRQRERIELWQGALTYRDKRLRGFDAAAVVEVIEHLDPPRMAAFERVVFGDAKPSTVVVTTPNVEYNALFDGLPDGQLRHRDHRFEWTRAEFARWADAVAAANGYEVTRHDIGPLDAEVGSPTQMAVFRR
jgi:3' terminal RNA ribose 2'-O-methyltransferase Hen1